MTQRIPVIVLDDKILRQLASDVSFQKDFGLPAIPVSGSKTGCSPCQQRAAARQMNIEPIKARLLSMGVEKQIAFKNRLNTKRIEIKRLEGREIKTYAF